MQSAAPRLQGGGFEASFVSVLVWWLMPLFAAHLSIAAFWPAVRGPNRSGRVMKALGSRSSAPTHCTSLRASRRTGRPRMLLSWHAISSRSLFSSVCRLGGSELGMEKLQTCSSCIFHKKGTELHLRLGSLSSELHLRLGSLSRFKPPLKSYLVDSLIQGLAGWPGAQVACWAASLLLPVRVSGPKQASPPTALSPCQLPEKEAALLGTR